MDSPSNPIDVAIIGGGPAGISAALWCSDLGLKAVLLEQENEFGGQLLRTHNAIENYLGVEAPDGRHLRDIFVKHAAGAKYDRVLSAKVKSADLTNKILKLASGKEVSANAIIIATGVRRRKLEIPGEGDFIGRGVLVSGVGERDKVRAKRVVIIGGGDAALENSLLLSEYADKVLVLHRREHFSARTTFLERARNSANIEIMNPVTVRSINGDAVVSGVSIRNESSGECSDLQADAVLIRIGVQPNTETFREQIELDDNGYVLTDNACATSLAGVFAVGDVANPKAPTISGAVGTGATAAKAIVDLLAELDR
jgi:thioredoxin reductase (NADPH)